MYNNIRKYNVHFVKYIKLLFKTVDIKGTFLVKYTITSYFSSAASGCESVMSMASPIQSIPNDNE